MCSCENDFVTSQEIIMAQYAIHAEVLCENMIPAVFPQFCSQPAVHYREIL